MRKKVKIFKRLIKWIFISVFSIALVLFTIIYFSSKKIEGYWVNSKYVEYDSNNDSIIGISNDVILFKNKSFKVINDNYTNTLHFNDSIFKLKNIRFKTKFQKQKWKRVQKKGLDILFFGINNDSPYFVFDKTDSIITLKKLEGKEINIQFIEIEKLKS